MQVLWEETRGHYSQVTRNPAFFWEEMQQTRVGCQGEVGSEGVGH